MRSKSLALIFSLVLGAPASAQVAIPDTPAGRTLAAWLEAFNSADRAQAEAYMEKHGGGGQSVDGMLGFRNQTGGFELLGIDNSEPLAIEYRVKERGGPMQAVGRLVVTEGEPPRVTRSLLRATPPGATVAGFAIDAETRNRVIDGVIAKLKDIYVLEDEAIAMADALGERRARGDYDDVTNGDEFAELLTKHLRDNAIKVVIHKWQPSEAIQNAIRAGGAKLVVLDAGDPGVVVERALAKDGLQQILKKNLDAIVAAAGE